MENNLRSYIQRTRQHNLDNPDDQKVMRFSNEAGDRNATTADQYVDKWNPNKDTFSYDEDSFTAETERQLETPGTGFDYNQGGPPAPKKKAAPTGPPKGYKPPDYSEKGRSEFQNVVFNQIGGNPFGYEPMQVVQEHMSDENLEPIFEQAFGGRVLYADRDQLDTAQAKHWQQTLQAYRAHVRDQAAAHKNSMIEQYKFMMGEFDAKAQSYAAAQKSIEEKISKAQGSLDKKIGAIMEARYGNEVDEQGNLIDNSQMMIDANKKAFELVGQGVPVYEAIDEALRYAEARKGPLGRILDDMAKSRQPAAGEAQAAPGGWDQVKETQFRGWYDKVAKSAGINPDPDDPQHFYDYRAAYAAGVKGPDKTGHWPSEFKTEGHPRMVVDGKNTKTGAPAVDADLERKRNLILFGTSEAPAGSKGGKKKLDLKVPKTGTATKNPAAKTGEKSFEQWMKENPELARQPGIYGLLDQNLTDEQKIRMAESKMNRARKAFTSTPPTGN
jgi:hypothetical protein